MITTRPSIQDVQTRLDDLIQKKEEHWFFQSPINPDNKIAIGDLRLTYRHWIYYIENGDSIDKEKLYTRTCTESKCVAPLHYVTVLKSYQYRRDEWTDNEWELIRRRLKNQMLVDKNSGCWIWQGQKTADGYGQMGNRPAHAWSLMAFNLLSYFKGSVSQQVRHLCHTRLCICPDHLILGTFQDNIDDSVRDRRTILNKRKKRFSEEDVRSVKKYIREEPHKPRAEIAKILNLDRGFVHDVAEGHSWTHIGATEEDDDIHRRTTNRSPEYTSSIKNLHESALEDRNIILMFLERLKKISNPPICLTEEEKQHLEGDHIVVKLHIGDNGKMPYTKVAGYRLLSSHLSWIAANRKLVPENLVVRHKCKIKGCIAATHLELGTMADNAQDKIRDGTSLRGELCPTSKLTENDVLAILEKKRSDPNFKTGKVSREYNVSSTAISQICSGKRWGYLSKQQATEEKTEQSGQEDVV